MNSDPLNLRQLPPIEPPSRLWPAIDQRIRSPKRARWRAWVPAVAAAIVLGLVLGVLIQAPQQGPEFGSELAASGSPHLASPIEAAMAESADLEFELRAREQGSVTSEALAQLVLLEVELSWLDLLLAERPHDLALWQQRSDLLFAMILSYTEPVEMALWSTELL